MRYIYKGQKIMKKVIILMSTFNGEKYLDEQIESLLIQTGLEISIIVRDDGSTDNTIQILNKWKEKGVIEWYKGHNLGPGLSFMDLVKNTSEADYYAFCDQDDIWYSDKLISAVTMLSKSCENEPALYFSRARLVNENMELIGMTMENPSYKFGSVLIGSHAVGCTMVFNNRLRNLLKMSTPNNALHDAWTIRVCLAVNGKVYYDTCPHINYRQHRNNVIGVNKSRIDRCIRLINYYKKNKGYKLEITKALLDNYSGIIPGNNKEVLSKLSNYKKSARNKIWILKNKEIRRDNYFDNFIFWLSIMFNIF